MQSRQSIIPAGLLVLALIIGAFIGGAAIANWGAISLADCRDDCRASHDHFYEECENDPSTEFEVCRLAIDYLVEKCKGDCRLPWNQAESQSPTYLLLERFITSDYQNNIVKSGQSIGKLSPAPLLWLFYPKSCGLSHT